MRRFLKLVLFLLLGSGAVLPPLLPTLHAQQPSQTVTVTPDCIVSFSFTTATTGVAIDNRYKGCTSWTLSYASQGFTVVSLVVQSAPDAGGVPGTWVTFAGSIVTGINPNTATTQNSTVFSGYEPWVRANLTTATGTGTLVGALYGYRQPPVANITATLSGPVTVVGPAASGAALSGDPVRIGISDGTNAQNLISASAAANGNTGVGVPAVGPSLYNGTTWDREFSCPSRAAIATSASGLTQIVALSSTKIIYVCGWTLTVATPGSTVTASLVSGTGSNCATGTGATIAGPYSAITALVLNYPQWVIKGTVSEALCINLGSATSVTGEVFYGQL
jgi:hypothetical protein